jgi:uncharacterized iron-regulated protein
MRLTSAAAAARTLALCFCVLGAVEAVASDQDWQGWAEEAGKQHPLAGKLYQPLDAPFLSWWVKEDTLLTEGRDLHYSGPGTLSEAKPDGPLLADQRLLLLGEVHDNPIHHRLRAWVIQRNASWLPSLKGREARPAVVFEQLNADQQVALNDFWKHQGMPTADRLVRELEWDKSGWPPAEIYKPLLEAVIAASLPIRPGDPARGRVRAVARGGLAALAPEERTRLRLDTPLAAPLAEDLDRELVDSHCGALPPQAIPGMAAAQRYRDAHLAEALLAAEQRHGSAILIAGNGHVRSDRGVPWYIRKREPDARVISVLLVEVEEGKTDPAAYVPRDPDGKPAADLVIFTPRAKRDDPCQSFLKKAP